MADPGKNPTDTALAVIGAAALTLTVFLLLPLSRMLSPDPAEERWSLRQVERVEIPPPPPPEPEPVEKPAASAEASPDLRPPPPNPPLRSLPVALDVRPDPDLFATPAIHSLAGDLDVGDEIRRFTFDDLKGGPRVLSVPPVSIPVALARRGFGRGKGDLFHPYSAGRLRRGARRRRKHPPRTDRSRPAVGRPRPFRAAGNQWTAGRRRRKLAPHHRIQPPMKRRLATIALLALPLLLRAEPVDLRPEEYSWDNPGFRERFAGTYGVLSPVEPQISPEESRFLREEILPRIAADPGEAVTPSSRSDSPSPPRPPSTSSSETFSSRKAGSGRPGKISTAPSPFSPISAGRTDPSPFSRSAPGIIPRRFPTGSR